MIGAALLGSLALGAKNKVVKIINQNDAFFGALIKIALAIKHERALGRSPSPLFNGDGGARTTAALITLCAAVTGSQPPSATTSQAESPQAKPNHFT